MLKIKTTFSVVGKKNNPCFDCIVTREKNGLIDDN